MVTRRLVYIYFSTLLRAPIRFTGIVCGNTAPVLHVRRVAGLAAASAGRASGSASHPAGGASVAEPAAIPGAGRRRQGKP
eukprot:scaffold57145_cov36-Phaeocystis_antarctica.AAC.2